LICLLQISNVIFLSQSGTGETQLVTLPLAMATAISNQGNQQAPVQQPQQDNSQQSPVVQVHKI